HSPELVEGGQRTHRPPSHPRNNAQHRQARPGARPHILRARAIQGGTRGARIPRKSATEGIRPCGSLSGGLAERGARQAQACPWGWGVKDPVDRQHAPADWKRRPWASSPGECVAECAGGNVVIAPAPGAIVSDPWL